MDTKLDSRQAQQQQFPATFPDTFKNFFEMMNEDEDHVDLFSNLLEDKIIPRSSNNNVCANPRRTGNDGRGNSFSGAGGSGGSFGDNLRYSRNHSHSGNDVSLMAPDLSASTSSMHPGTSTTQQHSGRTYDITPGRSHSFRSNRSRNSISSNSINQIGRNNYVGEADSSSISSNTGHNTDSSLECNRCGSGVGGSGITGGGSCKHIKYCCLHQNQEQHHHDCQRSQSTHSSPHRMRNLNQHQHQHQHQKKDRAQPKPLPPNVQNFVDYCSGNIIGVGETISESGARIGPDGSDNNKIGGSSVSGGAVVIGAGYLNAERSNNVKIRFQQSQQQKQPQEKRHSVILERAFDFDFSCDDMSGSTSTLPSSPSHIPPLGMLSAGATPTHGNVLKPILKQSLQQQQQQQQHQQQYEQNPYNQELYAREQYAGQQHQQHQKYDKEHYQLYGQEPYNQKYNETAFLQQQQQQQPNVMSQQQPNVMPQQQTKRLLPTPPIKPMVNQQRILQQSTVGGYYTGPSTSAAAAAAAVAVNPNNYNNYPQYNDGGSMGPRPAASNNYLVDQASTATSDYSIVHPSQQQSHTNTRNTRTSQSPNCNRRRSSSVAGSRMPFELDGYRRGSYGGNNQNDYGGLPGGSPSYVLAKTTAFGSTKRGSIPGSAKPCIPRLPVESGVLTFQQAMSGAVSPQYSINSTISASASVAAKTAILNGNINNANKNSSASATTTSVKIGEYGDDSVGLNNTHYMMGMGGASSTAALASVMEDATASGPDADNSPTNGDTPTSDDLHPIPGLTSSTYHQQPHHHQQMRERPIGEAAGNPSIQKQQPQQSQSQYPQQSQFPHQSQYPQPSHYPQKHHHHHHGSSMYLGNRQRQRMRTSSMPGECRKPRLVDTRRAAIHCGDIDMEYYRLRSFSITSHGVCNLGDSLRSRRSRSINSVQSSGTASDKTRHNSNASGGDVINEGTEAANASLPNPDIPAYKIAMLGASGVGKTTLTYQFTTSDYICAYDLSLDDDYGQKTVSVLVDNIETDLEVVDHPASEMSTEAFCSTYNIDLFVVVYSICDRNSYKVAEKVLQYLKENEMLMTRGAILVGNKTDLQRNRVVTQNMGRKVAREIACKFIETSSGIDHNVNELLVGIVAQVKLNPQRLKRLSAQERQRLSLQNVIQKHRRMGLPPRRIVRQNSMCQHDADGDEAVAQAAANAAQLERQQQLAAAAAIADGPSTSAAAAAAEAIRNHDPNKTLATISAKVYRGGVVRKQQKRPLNLESILKMGESEMEDEDEIQRLHEQGYRPMTKFELLMSGVKPDFIRGGIPFTHIHLPPEESYNQDNVHDEQLGAVGGDLNSNSNEANGGQRKSNISLTARTKIFLASVMRFKRAIMIKRRSSSNCSDLFVI